MTPLLLMANSYPILMFAALAIGLDDPFGHDANDINLTTICARTERNLCSGEPPSNARCRRLGAVRLPATLHQLRSSMPVNAHSLGAACSATLPMIPPAAACPGSDDPATFAVATGA